MAHNCHMATCTLHLNHAVCLSSTNGCWIRPDSRIGVQSTPHAVRLMWLAQIERDEFLRPFQSYISRFRGPYEASYSQDPLYYSLDVGRAPYPNPI